jgi:hypothetical protein
MRHVIVEGTLHGCSFVRLYLLDGEHVADLIDHVNHGYDYIFAYSLVDLGEVEGFSREKKLSQFISLDGAEDVIFGRLHKTNRKKIRRTYRDHEVDIVIDDPAGQESYEFYCRVKKAEGVRPDFAADFSSVRWINAYHREELISSTSWYHNDHVLRGKHYVSIRKQSGIDTALVGRLTRRLFWEACVLGIRGGLRYVDLGGLDPHDPSKQGIYEFKRSFGGDTQDIYIYRRYTKSWERVKEEVTAQGMAVL